MHILSVKNFFLLLFSLLSDWNYFWNKYCNFPFLAICRSLFLLLIFLASSWYQKPKIGLQMSFQNKQMIKYFHINGLLKQLVIKQSPTFLSFSFLIDCCIKVFSFLIKAFGNFEKLIRFHWQASILCKSGENWKILIEIFFQKLMASSVIFAFLDHLKPTIFFIGQPWWPAPFQNLWIRPCSLPITLNIGFSCSYVPILLLKIVCNYHSK